VFPDDLQTLLRYAVSRETPRGTVRFWLDVVATLAAVSGCALLAWLNWGTIFPPAPRVPEAPISLEGAMLRGNAAAPVVVIEYSDYLCPFCARFETDVLPELALRYIETGRVQLALKQHPLEGVHPGATMAAEAALCAWRVGKPWEMHKALLRDPKGLNESRLMALAREVGIDEEEFGPCLAGEVSEQVSTDVREAELLGLSGTPAFLVGRRLVDGTVRVVAVVNGARPVADFEKAIDQALRSSGWTRAIVAGGGAVAILALGFGLKRHRLLERGGMEGR
jgi:protein-disulfide isomerase